MLDDQTDAVKTVSATATGRPTSRNGSGGDISEGGGADILAPAAADER